MKILECCTKDPEACLPTDLERQLAEFLETVAAAR